MVSITENLPDATSLLQQAWAEHKKVHQKPAADSWLFITKRGRARSKAMPAFSWTGELRPDRVSPRSEASRNKTPSY